MVKLVSRGETPWVTRYQVRSPADHVKVRNLQHPVKTQSFAKLQKNMTICKTQNAKCIEIQWKSIYLFCKTSEKYDNLQNGDEFERILQTIQNSTKNQNEPKDRPVRHRESSWATRYQVRTQADQYIYWSICATAQISPLTNYNGNRRSRNAYLRGDNSRLEL